MTAPLTGQTAHTPNGIPKGQLLQCPVPDLPPSRAQCTTLLYQNKETRPNVPAQGFNPARTGFTC